MPHRFFRATPGSESDVVRGSISLKKGREQDRSTPGEEAAGTSQSAFAKGTVLL
ncbi:hypothetical protein SLNWT_6144 [Streptomyces albus]|uniref:Uncharacterized protein n=1 Tax=Streptomyces albus (strain ATCC 21838 / DSM 41398 / FERM P-419 / JCM 4703 / NBRC 107858) TaxID=1081613 RepID=A0A0B5F4J9_STRA4|nr:hypothetical protein SLNWT_6144 [Streptomyces albus]AOU80824.1 hypothetical protein SLNHY_6133 [Streptomyces albus]